jgi:hypothetical protein
MLYSTRHRVEVLIIWGRDMCSFPPFWKNNMIGEIVYKRFSLRTLPAGSYWGVIVGEEFHSFPDGKGGMTEATMCWKVFCLPVSEDKKKKSVEFHMKEHMTLTLEEVLPQVKSYLSNDNSYTNFLSLSREDRLEAIKELM